jgi:DNA mismatch repair protein MutL
MAEAPRTTQPMRRGSRIAELPEVVRNQIAAGEVVERPASAVKELVENAVDAGATNVRVDLEGGGVALVRVTDDGSGMGAEDLALAFLPHATSKLFALEDLDHIASLGFRGEALASLGAVSRARILTREPHSPTGWVITNEGGRIGDVREAGAPPGTTVEIRDLFFNTPARRRFLKRDETELARCLDVLQRLALAHVGVGFVVTHDGRRLIDVEASMDLRARVRRLFDGELSAALVEVESESAALSLGGLVAPPRFARRDASRQMWFLNGRPLRDKLLARVLKEGYRGFLVEGRQPTAFLSLRLDPKLVDVNVHPTKSEVRFREERRVFGQLVAALRDAVARTDIATPGDRLLESAGRRGAWVPPARETGWLPDPGAEERPASSREAASVAERPYDIPQAGAPRAAEAAWRGATPTDGPLLQVARTYIVRALPDGFEIVDQHALHERLTYEGLRAELRAGRVAVQRRLVPEIVELSRDEIALVEANLDGLARLGIELSIFGPREVAVQGLPARLRDPDAAGIVRDAVGMLVERGTLPEADEVLEELLHRTACRSSVMAGDELDQSQMRALLDRAASLDAGADQTCPHSRPTRVRFTLADLEKAFHRR